MTVIAHVVIKGVSREQYDKVREVTGWLERQPDGGFAHLAWWEGEDNHNVDVWDNEEAFAAFGTDRLGPAMAQLGIEAVPEVTFHEAHEVFLPQALTIT
jgi:hypothetical protein